MTAGIVLHDDQATAVLRPDSRIVVLQTVAPLDRDLERFGNLTPEQGRINVAASGVLDASGAALGGVDSAPEQDWFAPSEYSAMRDGQRLSAPNYERMDAVVSSGADGVVVPQRARDQILAPSGHETRLFEPDRFAALGTVTMAIDDAMTLVRGTVAAAGATQLAGIRAEGARVTLAPTSYVVVDAIDGTPISAAAVPYAEATAAAAAQPLARAVASHAVAA